MKTTSLVGVLAALLCLSAQAADNAPPNSESENVPTFSLPFWEGWGYDPWYRGYRHASTYAEGVLNGWANYWQGLGQYNFWSALAAAEQEKARAMYLENRAKALATRYELRRIREEARTCDVQNRPTHPDLARWAKQVAPKRLTYGELDPATGKINWPHVLRQNLFATERAELEKLFADRSPEHLAIGSVSHHRAIEFLSSMEAKLKSQIDVLPPSEYLTAKKFLAGLRAEAQARPPETRIAAAPVTVPEKAKTEVR